MTKPVPVILAGFGYWVRNRTVVPLLKQYPDTMRVVAVTSLKEGKEEFEKSVKPEFEENGWDVPEFINDFEAACCAKDSLKEEPKAVLVTTPNGLHFHQAKIAIEEGHHVYVERPIATPNDPLPELIELADNKAKLLFTGPQRRLEDPFRYLHRAVTEENCEFGKLKRIRCYFAAGHRQTGWRRDLKLAGGGIVLDNGYHLLDIVAWLISSIGIEISGQLNGAVHFCYDEPMYYEDASRLEVETGAIGYIELPEGILLSFDFTYNAPEDSIFEQVELSDQNYTRIRLTRDQAERTPLPATITHQRGKKGKLVGIDTSLGQRIRAEAIRFSSEALNLEPLRMFIGAVNGNLDNTEAVQARNSLTTWHLVKEIYRLA